MFKFVSWQLVAWESFFKTYFGNVSSQISKCVHSDVIFNHWSWYSLHMNHAESALCISCDRKNLYLCWIDPGLLPDAHLGNLTPQLNRTGRQNKMKKFMGWNKDRKITVTVMDQTYLGKINLLTVKIELVNWKQRQNWNNTFFPCFSTDSTSLIHSQLLYLLPPPRAAQEDGQWELWSVHNSFSLMLLTPHTFPLFTTAFSTESKGISAMAPGASPRSPLHWPWCLPGCLPHCFPLTPLPVQNFCPFLNIFL